MVQRVLNLVPAMFELNIIGSNGNSGKNLFNQNMPLLESIFF